MVALTGAPTPPLDIGSRQITVIQPPKRLLQPEIDVPEVTELHDGVWHEAPAPAPAPAPAAPPAVPPPVPPLPAVLRRRGPVASPPVTAAPTAPAEAAAPPRVLLVDDSEIALRFLEARLGRWLLTIDRANTSAQALARLDEHSYDFIFLDVELGERSELDGLALCQHIKQSPSTMHASVIMVSAHHTQLDRVRGSLAGCDAYLSKPLDEVELRRLLLRQGLKAPKDAGTAPA
jgi:CheY-like chemotaxis protein